MDHRRQSDDGEDQGDPQAAMKQFALPKEDVDALVAYLISIKKK